MPADTPVNNFAKAVADRIHHRKLRDGAVGFDILTLIMFLVPLVVDLIKMLQECRTSPEDEKALVRSPGPWTRWRVWWAIGRVNEPYPAGVTRRDVYDAILLQASIARDEEIKAAVAYDTTAHN